MSLLSLLEGLLGAKKVEVNKATQYKKKYDPKDRIREAIEKFSSKDIEVTPDYNEVIKAIEEKDPLIFVSGRAGTGKTTLIDYIRDYLKANVIVVAPTGVAAIQARGLTIHSFFKFPFHVIFKHSIKTMHDRDLYKNIKLLIIDEVSMVRCDQIDGIDLFLRKNGPDPSLRFGGIQVIFVGDLFQLPPIVKQEDDKTLKLEGYKNSSGHYFFFAKVFQEQKMTMIELQKVFRQKNEHFSNLLKHIRVNEGVDDAIKTINEHCYKPNEQKNDLAITLTTTNQKADSINSSELAKLTGFSCTYTGIATGSFDINKEGNLPSPARLTLKVGAKVMFTANDVARRWVNGTIGKVTFCKPDCVTVEFNNQKVYVTPHEWKSTIYRFDAAENKIFAEVDGQYIQMPLMLAWAVTIHKSQGKTIDNIFVDLGNRAFASGQTYVALSRCPTLDGIRLERPITAKDIYIDEEIRNFYINSF